MDSRDYRKFQREELGRFFTRSKGQLQANKFNQFGRRSPIELMAGATLSDRIIDNGEGFTNYGPLYATRSDLQRARRQKMISEGDWHML